MRLVITGGGTGGHVYPALEVARVAQERDCEIIYLGSIRGQEGALCGARNIEFHGFPSAPLYSLRSPRGWRSLVGLLHATLKVKTCIKELRPDAVLSTGGYSAAPVMAVARKLRVPYVIHEANSVPGRSNRMFAKEAAAFTYLFKTTQNYVRATNAIRVGNPIRRELRQAAQHRKPAKGFVVVVGGSQGSAFLNSVCPQAATDLARGSVRWVHAFGRKNVIPQVPDHYNAVPYLEAPELIRAYSNATVAVARSGSTLAEFAMFGLPSVLIPLPSSADNHQLHNAEEFVALGAATLVEQKDATPSAVAEAISGWLDDEDRCFRAATALREWDIPDSAERILEQVLKAAKR